MTRDGLSALLVVFGMMFTILALIGAGLVFAAVGILFTLGGVQIWRSV